MSLVNDSSFYIPHKNKVLGGIYCFQSQPVGDAVTLILCDSVNII